MGFVYELPWMRDNNSILGWAVKDWQVNGIYSAFSGTPFTIGGNNAQLLAPGAGSITTNQSGDVNVINDPSRDVKWIDTTIFSNPTGLQWGNSGRNAFRGAVGVEPRLLVVPQHPDWPLPRRVPGPGVQRAQSHAVDLRSDTNINNPTFMQFVSSTAPHAFSARFQCNLAAQARLSSQRAANSAARCSSSPPLLGNVAVDLQVDGQ